MAIYRGTGGSSTTTDETTVNAVNQKAAEAATSATNAASSASSAATSASTANTKASQASTSATSAATSATQAAASKNSAALSATNAAASKLAAENAKTAAETAETNAILFGNMANTAAGDADADRILAEAAAASANTYAAAALVSANNAASYDSAVEANATAAALSETNAAASESAAAVSAIAADASANDAATSEANAAASETASAASAASASTSATTATTQATAASASALAAATSESNASTSETNAAASASAASTSEINAAASESAAASSQTAAEAAKDAALEALDSFDDRYLGQKAADPTVDNDGNALVAGALYFNTTDDVMKVYEGSTWVAAYASLSGALLQNNNLSDVLNVPAARTNLGLGTAATTAATDYATAAQGALAESAIQTETDPVFTAWDKSTGISITESQISDFGSYQPLATVLTDTTASYTTAEKTKLAGIETGATADQTAQEITTAIDADATAEATLKTALGLGTAAYTASTAYATAAQGALADTALQSFTETDPIYTASSWYTTTNNALDWDTAYGWGNHAGLYASVSHTHNYLPLSGGTLLGRLNYKQQSISASTASTIIDLSVANDFKVTLSSNTAFTFSNASVGQQGIIYLLQDSTGGRTITLPSNAKTPLNGAAIVQETGASSVSILSYVVLDASNILVNYVGDFA